MAFVVFCAFVFSYLLHIGSRIPVLGAISIDAVLGGLALALVLLRRPPILGMQGRSTEWAAAGRWLMYLVAFIVVSLPFVKWPGSVIRFGIEPFAKAVFFYILAVRTINSPYRLETFIWVLVVAQAVRVLEPLYLHVTTGYWGSTTNMGNWVTMNRLSGAPSDVVNPNGLAFIIVTTWPLLHYVVGRSLVGKLLYVVLLPLFAYALLLTGSRSGFIVLIAAALLMTWRSRHKVWVGVILACGFFVLLGQLSGLQQQRYESIVSRDAAGAETFEGRLKGVRDDFRVALSRPLFGHGLGTSPEANANFRGVVQRSHNLVTECAQEIGFIGLAIFVGFLVAAVRECRDALKAQARVDRESVGTAAAEAVLVVMAVGAIFALASYGLSEFYWYLWAGLCVSIGRIEQKGAATSVMESP